MTSSDTFTAPSLEETELRRVPPSGEVREDPLPTRRFIKSGPGWLGLMGSAMLAFATTASSIALPPPAHAHRWQTSSAVSSLSTPRGRRISLAEARRLALAAMAQAEQRRATFAEREAKLLAIWEEGA